MPSLQPLPTLSFLDLAAADPAEVLRELGARAEAAGCARPGFADALLARERSAPTGLPTVVPVAIPHVDPETVLRPGIGLVRLAEPVAWPEMGSTGRTVEARAVLMLLVGADDGQVDVLSRLLQVLQGSDWWAELSAATDVGQACASFRRRLAVG